MDKLRKTPLLRPYLLWYSPSWSKSAGLGTVKEPPQGAPYKLMSSLWQRLIGAGRGCELLSNEFPEPALKIWQLNREEGYGWFDEARGINIHLNLFGGGDGSHRGNRECSSLYHLQHWWEPWYETTDSWIDTFLTYWRDALLFIGVSLKDHVVCFHFAWSHSSFLRMAMLLRLMAVSRRISRGCNYNFHTKNIPQWFLFWVSSICLWISETVANPCPKELQLKHPWKSPCLTVRNDRSTGLSRRPRTSKLSA